ncbi:MAG: hypothetical protein Kow0027_29390 [Saprospiraceae bacterium]
MKDLIELVQVVSKNKAKNLEIIGQGKKTPSNKTEQLYELLHSGKVRSKEEAIEILFKKNQNPEQALDKTIKKLEKKLLTSILFIDLNQPKFRDIQKAYYRGHQEFASLKILTGRSVSLSIRRRLAEELYRMSLKFEFTDLALLSLRQLSYIYLLSEGNPNLLKKLNNQIALQVKKLEAELLAEEYYQNLAVHFVKSRASYSFLEPEAIEYVKELEKIPDDHRTASFYLNYYRVKMYRYHIVYDHQRVLQSANEAMGALSPKKHLLAPTAFLTFQISAISSMLHLGHYNEAKVEINRYLEEYPAVNHNWFIIKEYELLLYLHTGNYQEALEVFLEAFNKPERTKLPSVYQERWLLMEAFIHYLVMVEKAKPTLKQEAQLKGFKLGRFLNQIAEFSKDKQGANIAVLSLQILFLLRQNKQSEVIDRVEALKAYTGRHLRKNDTYRSSCFIKMLTQIPLGHFHKRTVYERAKKYIKKLAEMPLSKAPQSSEMEPIPYEKLWELTYEALRG